MGQYNFRKGVVMMCLINLYILFYSNLNQLELLTEIYETFPFSLILACNFF